MVIKNSLVSDVYRYDKYDIKFQLCHFHLVQYFIKRKCVINGQHLC